ncbi:tryparedoxin-like protein [Leishmania mexicana MHOM/GT/2001/U1103]|uniref:protein-disulfide reductase n=1 Tax=Leishmania mexicana (strain MHOM/GT/2001/U1103) TaxID=929439 RepID=E9ALV9_LEIMU|nr:tryparedoxin-like protein [Leishmania mexicana MHOM/GT/2001/U1103]CBZ23914.1 tryparedoxin-like protein [Leishmania mexicana MHOM/GT/2001/U1103]
MSMRHKGGPFLSQFPDLKVLRQDGTTVAASEAFKGKKYVLIYFSAHWCPPCQRFTPLLADFYDAHKDRYGFEVLFVSSDREEGRMMDFFQNRSSNYVRRPPAAASSSPPPTASSEALDESCPLSCDITHLLGNQTGAGTGGGAALSECPLPQIPFSAATAGGAATAAGTAQSPRIPKASGHGNWLALPFKEHEVARFLSRAYSVVSIPKVVVVAVDTNCMVTREGKTMVMKDPDAVRFPWRFAEGDMRNRTEGWRESFVLLLLIFCGVYYYFWYY